jgi:integrase
LQRLFPLVNNEHRHSGIAKFTPEMVHYNLVNEVIQKRNSVFQKAYKSTHERFVKGVSKAKLPENEVWINKPESLKDIAKLKLFFLSFLLTSSEFGFTFHDFRRTFGTRWSKFLRPFELKKIMRHKELRTTDKYYVHFDIDEVRNKMNG